MKVNINDEFNFVVFLNKYYKIDPNNNAEENIKDLILRLENFYDINIRGMYRVDVYSDSIYGIILDIKKEEADYLDCFYNEIDMQVILKEKKEFLYKINNIDILNLFDIKNIYLYNDELYVSLNSNKNIIYLFEYMDVIYKDIDLIINNSKVLKKEEVVIDEETSNSFSRKT